MITAISKTWEERGSSTNELVNRVSMEKDKRDNPAHLPLETPKLLSKNCAANSKAMKLTNDRLLSKQNEKREREWDADRQP